MSKSKTNCPKWQCTALWKELKKKAKDENQFIAAMEQVCNFAVDRSKYINLTFPMFTLHDEQHIINVIKLMENLLGDRLEELNRDEAAMLILAACCHDIGMSCSDLDSEKQDLLKSDQFKQYLDKHHGEHVKYHELKKDDKDYTKKLDAIFRGFLRSIHHTRIKDLLPPVNKWTSTKMRNELIDVCTSHGKRCEEIEKMSVPKHSEQADLRMCAVLLRLADILDFDTSRAPLAIYNYCGFNDAEETDNNNEKDIEKDISKKHWDNHMASRGFHFTEASKRGNYYELYYSAECETMQIHQSVNSYLDWVDQELKDCGTLLKKLAGRWNDLVLPWKVDRDITPIGYLPGEYLFTLDQSQVLNLLGGEELYSDPAAFVRELLQNAIDAVRTREAFDHEAKRSGWKPQIKIRTWTDKDGDWFRIEDNGTGMTKEIIEKHLLKVGSSYYNSDEFKKEKLRSRADDYTPISRFGIGILSCFMGDKEHSRVEISTKRYGENYPPALRLRMDGLNGYYAMYSSEKDDNHPGDMPGTDNNEKEEYRNEPGTVVAVRTNLYRTGKYHGFKEIVDKWLVFPPVPVHYDGPDGACDYPTQEEFMKTVHDFAYSDDLAKDGVMEFPLSQSQLDEIRKTFPGIKISDSAKVVLKCVDLGRYSQTPDFTGAMLVSKIEPKIEDFLLVSDEEGLFLDEEMSVNYKVTLNESTLKLDLSIHDYWEPENYLQNLIETIPIVLQKEKMLWHERFRQIIQNTSNNSISVHNGIFCGRADFINNEWHQQDTILLLRDGYRPEMNLARNNIEHLSLEPLFICEVVRQQLSYEGFYIGHDFILDRTYRLSPSEAFLSVLENYTHWMEQLTVYTEKKYKLPLTKLEKTLKDKKSLKLSASKLNFLRENLDTKFVMAYLQANCVVYLNDSLYEIILQEGNSNCQNDGWKLFPPGFFIPVENGNESYFTRADQSERCGCNACHRLSKFLLSKAKEIKSKSPGCFNRIVSAIADDAGNELISVLNDQLNILKNIPDNPLGVTDDLMLEESDLIY